MKIFHLLFACLLMGLSPLVAHAQMGTSCMGCMPRTGPVYDSTMTTPSPAFTTSASTGDVYIPPREIIVTVPAPPAPPAPVGNDPFSFTSTQFTCSAGGVGNDGARGAILAIYKSQGGRCADESGLTWWSSNLVNCVAGAQGWPIANGMNTAQYANEVTNCQIALGNLSSDQPSMNDICRNDASTRGFLTNAYNYVRGPSSATCSK